MAYMPASVATLQCSIEQPPTTKQHASNVSLQSIEARRQLGCLGKGAQYAAVREHKPGIPNQPAQAGGFTAMLQRMVDFGRWRSC
jgi:hypothetical protein